MIKTYIDIQNVIIENIKVLEKLQDSLQKEFEYLLSFTSDQDLLKSKKRQVNTVDFLLKDFTQILKASINLFELKEKTEFCLINFGISKFEYDSFINQPLTLIIEMAKKQKKENSVQLPIIFKHVIDYTDLKPEVKEIHYSASPILGLEKLKAMARNNPGILKQNF